MSAKKGITLEEWQAAIGECIPDRCPPPGAGWLARNELQRLLGCGRSKFYAQMKRLIAAGRAEVFAGCERDTSGKPNARTWYRLKPASGGPSTSPPRPPRPAAPGPGGPRPRCRTR
jgi:hypothetical protein